MLRGETHLGPNEQTIPTYMKITQYTVIVHSLFALIHPHNKRAGLQLLPLSLLIGWHLCCSFLSVAHWSTPSVVSTCSSMGMPHYVTRWKNLYRHVWLSTWPWDLSTVLSTGVYSAIKIAFFHCLSDKCQFSIGITGSQKCVTLVAMLQDKFLVVHVEFVMSHQSWNHLD
jgi:hypothetical protein